MKKSLLFMFALSLVVLSCKRGFDDQSAQEPLALNVSELAYTDQIFGAMQGSLSATQSDPATGLDARWGSEDLPMSRVTESKFQTGDEIGVYIHSAKPMAAGNIHSTNMRYVTSDEGATWRAANAMSGALTAANYFATAYHPYQSTVSNIAAVAHTVLADQSATEGDAAGNLEKSDFMSVNDATVNNIATAPASTLDFVHRMSKFQIKISIPSFIEGVAVLSLKSVKIKGLKVKGTVNLASGAVTVSTNAADVADITPRKLSGTNAASTISTYEAVVFPQTVAASSLLVEFVCTVTGNVEKTLSYTVPAGTTLPFTTGKRLVLTLSSSADVAFMSDLDLMDGLAKTGLALKIKAPLAAAWKLESPAAWLKLCLTAVGGNYGASVSGTGTGVEQTVYVSVDANATEAAANWKARETTLKLTATTTPASTPASYLVVQGYNRFEVEDKSITLISDSPMRLPSVKSNQVWKLKGTLPAWIKITNGPVKWANTNAGNTINVTAAGYDVIGSIGAGANDLYAVADPATLTKIGGTTATGLTSASVALTYGATPVNVYWTHSFSISNVPARPLIWSSGNLVSVNTTAVNTAGQGGARIGNMYDGGLYFRFGSLVGLKGGATGSGVGTAVATHDTGYWLRPEGHTSSTTWANSAYFSDESKISGDFKTYHPTDNAGNDGIGDACRYYLGAPWRLPTGDEFGDLCNKQYAIATNVGWAATGGKETSSPTTTLYGGWWNGTASSTTALASAAYFVGSGHRGYTDGSLYGVGTQGVYWSSSVSSATYGLYLDFYAGYVVPEDSYNRVHGFTLRCVQ